METNCKYLHKSKKIKLEYKLGYSDQKVQITVVARPIEEKPERYGTYGEIEPEEAISPSFKSYEGDLFEVCNEFDLHSVMAATETSIQPAKPVNVIRKYK